MNFKISNYRGVSLADLTVDGITLLAGDNGHGKTACCQAIGGILSGKPLVYDLPAKKAKAIIRHGQKEAMVSAIDGENSVSVILPDGKLSTVGANPPAISAVAAGLVHIADMKDIERQRFLTTFLAATPTKEQLAAELPDIDAALIERLWEHIQVNGWDTAHASAKEKGAGLKGEWKATTGGEVYGKNKAETWHPAVWEPDMMNITEEELLSQQKAAQEWRDAAIRSNAVSEAEIEALKQKAAQKDALVTAVADAETFAENWRTAVRDIEPLVRDGIPQKGAQIQHCPYCNKALETKGGIVQKYAGGMSDKDYKRAMEKYNTDKKDMDEARLQLSQAEVDVAKAKAALAAAKQAEKDLAKATPQTAADTDNTAEAEQRLAHAQARLDSFRAYHRALELHESIDLNAKIVAALAADGLRLRVLTVALTVANDHLIALCDWASWDAVTIAPDMSIMYGEVPYYLCSESEQWRVNAVLQIMVAKRDGSGMVILDRADVLQKAAKNGLFALLMAIGMNCLVAMSMSSPDEIPKAFNNGNDGLRAYWIEEGKTVRAE